MCGVKFFKTLHFGATSVGTSSVAQTTSVEGTDLVVDIIMTAPEGFEISKDETDFVNSLTLNQTNGSVAQTTIYVRFAPTVEQSYSTFITLESTDMATANLTVTGIGGSVSAYCAAGSTTCDEYISQVQFGDIDNTSACGNYSDYTSQTTDLQPGSTKQITVTFGVAYDIDDLGIWIDWNQDGDFDNVDENVVCQSTIANLEGSYDILMPTDALSGKIRIQLKYNGDGCESACGDTEYGEVKDYSVNVVSTENEAPTIKNPIAVQEANEGFGSLSIDLSDVFADADDVALTIVAISDNQNVVSATVNGNILTLSEVGTGTAKITVRADDGNGGITEQVFDMTINVITGLEELNDSGFKVYPNPTSDMLNIESIQDEIQYIKVVDMTGKVMIEKTGLYDRSTLDLSSLSHGIYVLSIETANDLFTSKIMKE